MNLFVTARPSARNRLPFLLFSFGAFTAVLSAGCGLSSFQQPAPAVSFQARGLRPAPAWVRERMTAALMERERGSQP